MKQAGFSVSELTIALGMTTIVTMTLVGLWLWEIEGANEVSGTTEITEESRVLRAMLGSGNQCTLNLASVPLSVVAPAGSAVPRLTNYDSAGRPAGILAQVGVMKNGVLLSDIHLKPLAQVDLSYIAATLELTFNKSSGFQGSAVRKIGILAQVEGGLVQQCWIKKDALTTTENQICLTASGGVLNGYDKTTGQCILTNGAWYQGTTPFVAQCPGGTKLPVLANGNSNCKVIQPAGFVDPDVPPPIILSDGTMASPSFSRNHGPAIFSIDQATQSCSCAYDIKIPLATVQTFQCNVLCVVL